MSEVQHPGEVQVQAQKQDTGGEQCALLQAQGTALVKKQPTLVCNGMRYDMFQATSLHVDRRY